jgi:broad specificity phosphatase PhoE
MVRVLLIRHGDLEDDHGCYWGWTDVSLSARGRAQADALGRRLASANIDAIYASDLTRAHETGRIVAQHHGVDVVACRDLRELNFGRAEGLDWAQIQEAEPDVAAALAAQDPSRPLPGGESLADLHKRVQRFVREHLTHDDAATVLVVAHGGSLRVLICRALGLALEDFWRIRVDRGSLSVISFPAEAGGMPSGVLELLNDTSHLE